MGRRKRGWKSAAKLSLATLREMLDQKQANLTARRAELTEELAAVEAELGEAGELNGVAAAPVKRGPGRPKGKRGPGRPKGSKNVAKAKVGGKKRPGRPAGPKGQSDLHNAIRAALKSSAEPMKLADLAEKVRKNGYKTASKNFGVILGLRLSEMADVKRVDRGVYTMK